MGALGMIATWSDNLPVRISNLDFLFIYACWIAESLY